jgi:drug/metabolite transporter (DMT)-like permease
VRAALLARERCRGPPVVTTATVVGTTLAATTFFALSTALKHRSAAKADAGEVQKRTVHFLRDTAVSPLWLGGMLADLGGLTLQITALHIGALAVVQPLMITALLFSLVLNHVVAGTRITGRELVGAGVLVAALVSFLFVSGASSPRITGPAQPADPVPAVALGVAAVVICLVCLAVARRSSPGLRAALTGATVGTAYAFTAALIKASSNVLVSHGLIALATSWQLYVAVVSGATGLVLTQLAFRAGPLRSSLPSIATVDPLVSIVLGVVVYDEHLRPGVLPVAGEVLCLLVLCGAAVYLGRMTLDDAEPFPASVVEPGVPTAEGA